MGRLKQTTARLSMPTIEFVVVFALVWFVYAEDPHPATALGFAWIAANQVYYYRKQRGR